MASFKMRKIFRKVQTVKRIGISQTLLILSARFGLNIVINPRLNEGIAQPFSCPICGYSRFQVGKVLWPALIEQWELNDEEVSYIDRQQGLSCLSCACILRSMTLADALRKACGKRKNFSELCATDKGFRRLKVLEVNEAGNLSPFLQKLPHRTLALYPEIDIQAMTYASDSFDIVIHSDTLEHVPNPVRALEECFRVLKKGGVLAYTVPVVFGRATRRRDGLPISFHGSFDTNSEDYKVVSEYGHDFYLEPYQAGFRQICMHSLLFPESTALICRKF